MLLLQALTRRLISAFPRYRGLFFIEGVQGYGDVPSHWGEDLSGMVLNYDSQYQYPSK